jgi:hypothetical protein
MCRIKPLYRCDKDSQQSIDAMKSNAIIIIVIAAAALLPPKSIQPEDLEDGPDYKEPDFLETADSYLQDVIDMAATESPAVQNQNLSAFLVADRLP